MMPVRLETAAPRSGVKHSTTKPLQFQEIEIILLLKKQSDQGLPCLPSDKYFVNSCSEKNNLRNEREKL